MKVVWSEGHFAEAVSTKCEMALVAPDGHVRHGAVRCKDFLTDAYYSEVVGKPVEIWGFRWKPGTLNLKDPIVFAVRERGSALNSRDALNMEMLISCFQLGKSGDLVVVTADGHGSLVVTAGPWWHDAPWRISFLTLLVRLAVNGRYNVKEDPYEFFERMTKDHVDGQWVKGTLEPLKIMLSGQLPAKLAKVKWSDYGSSHEVHHGGGVYSTWTGKRTG